MCFKSEVVGGFITLLSLNIRQKSDGLQKCDEASDVGYELRSR